MVLLIEKKKTVNKKAREGAKIKDIVGFSISKAKGRRDMVKSNIIVEVRFLTESFWSLR